MAMVHHLEAGTRPIRVWCEEGASRLPIFSRPEKALPQEQLQEAPGALQASLAEVASCHDEALALFHALERMPMEQWAVLSIRWSGCFAFEEMAVVFSWASPAEAKEHYAGAIARLCQELGSATPVPPGYHSWIAYLFG